jgi:hypothetical protein
MLCGGLFYSLFAKIKSLKVDNQIINKDLAQSSKMLEIQNAVNKVEDEQTQDIKNADISVVVNRMRKKKQ